MYTAKSNQQDYQNKNSGLISGINKQYMSSNNQGLQQQRSQSRLALSAQNNIFGSNSYQNSQNQGSDVSLSSMPISSSQMVHQQQKSILNLGSHKPNYSESSLRYMNSQNSNQYKQPTGMSNQQQMQVTSSTSHNTGQVSFKLQDQNMTMQSVTTSVAELKYNDEEDQVDPDEQNFLSNMEKIQTYMNKPISQMKRELEEQRKEKLKLEQEKKQRKSSTQKGGGLSSRNTSSSGLQRQSIHQKKNKNVTFRIDYFHKLEASFSQVRIVYGVFKKGTKPDPQHNTKYYEIHSHLRIFIKQVYKDLVPQEDLYMYIEIQAYQKSMSKLKKYWSILPMYTDFAVLNENKWKIFFYDEKYTVDQLFSDPIKPSTITNLLVKISRQNGQYDNDKTLFHTEYLIPYIQNYEHRTREKELKIQEENQKLLEEQRLKREQKEQNRLMMADNRVINANEIISDIEQDLNKLKNSDNPYIKNKQYRKDKFQDNIKTENSQLDIHSPNSNNKSGFQNMYGQESIRLNSQDQNTTSKRLRPKNWPPQKVTTQDIKEFQKEQQTIRLKPLYLYQMSGTHFNVNPKRTLAYTYNQNQNQNDSNFYENGQFKYTGTKPDFGQPLKLNKFEDHNNVEETQNQIDQRNYDKQQVNYQQDFNLNNNQPQQQSQQQTNNNTNYNTNQTQSQQPQSSYQTQSNQGASQQQSNYQTQSNQNQSPQQQSQFSTQQQQQQDNQSQPSQSVTNTQNQDNQSQSSIPQKQSEEPQKQEPKGKIRVSVKVTNLKNYTEDDPLGPDKQLIGPDGILTDLQGEECTLQAEELTEKNGPNEMVFGEDFQSFEIDIDAYKTKHKDFSQLNLVLTFMGETEDEEEFQLGWTFHPLFETNGKFINQGSFSRPLFEEEEPPIEKSPFDEKKYTKVDEVVHFIVKYEQI